MQTRYSSRQFINFIISQNPSLKDNDDILDGEFCIDDTILQYTEQTLEWAVTVKDSVIARRPSWCFIPEQESDIYVGGVVVEHVTIPAATHTVSGERVHIFS